MTTAEERAEEVRCRQDERVRRKRGEWVEKQRVRLNGSDLPTREGLPAAVVSARSPGAVA